MNTREWVKAVRDIQNEVRRRLYEDWDPIGVNGDAPHSEGEYDRYADEIVSIIFNSPIVDESKIRDHLRNAMYDYMGLTPCEELENKTERVIKLLVSFWQNPSPSR